MSHLNLCLHTGAKTATLDRVYGVPTPAGTDTWQPIAHSHLIERVHEGLANNELRVVQQAHGLSQDGGEYFGLMQVANGQDDGDFGLVVGVRNSHTKKFPAGLVLGSGVFVCDNLAFSGEIKIARKHTRFIVRDLPALVLKAIGRLIGMRTTQAQRFAKYKTTEISDRDVHSVLVRACVAGCLGSTSLLDVLRQWKEPNHLEFREGGKTLWRLFNGFTEVWKERPLNILPKLTMCLQGLLDPLCGFQTLAPQIAARAPELAQAT